MWDIPPEQLRATWKQGLLSTGYTVLTLPLAYVLPASVENVRIVARFVTSDQRVYEADKDIKVRLVPGAAEKRPQMMPEFCCPPPPTPITEGVPLVVPTSRVTTSTSYSAAVETVELAAGNIGRPVPHSRRYHDRPSPTAQCPGVRASRLVRA